MPLVGRDGGWTGSSGRNCNSRRRFSQRRAIASGASKRTERAALANLSDYGDFLDSDDFSDDKVNQLGIEAGNRVELHGEPTAVGLRHTGQGSRMNHFARTIALLISATSLIGCATLEVPYVPPGHAGGWDPVFGSCETCGTCGGVCEGHTPGSYLGHQLRCMSGCGEIYWGPWHSDPPDRCDPCDDCGDWVGDRCCAPKLRERFWWTITGQHGAAHHGKGCASCSGKGCSSCRTSGCSSCGGSGCSSCGGAVSHVPYYESDESSAPGEAPEPELIPGTPPPTRIEPETPASIRPLQGVSLALPFKIRSTRLER